MDRIPKPGEFYRHFKNNLYQVAAVAEHTETGEKMVVYQALYGDFKMYVRPLEMFISEVDRKKYPDAVQKYRFECIDSPASGINRVSPEKIETDKINESVLDFVEADSFAEKNKILQEMKKSITQKELDLIYTVLDIPEAEGDIKFQVDALERYMQTQMKYDGNRLRQ